jgi:carboxyl-terminal processing protease
MRKNRKTILFVVIICGFLGLATTLTDDFEITKNLELFSNIFRDVNINYADDIDPEKMMEAGLDGMLSSLDPYSVYIPARGIDQFMSNLAGHYAGIGSGVFVDNEYNVISEIFENSPAYKVGLRPGDKLISADGKSLKSMSISDVSNLLRGRAGSKVKLEYQRIGSGIKNVEITREEVYINNVPYFGMLKNKVGYISLSTFSENAGKNVANALSELKQKNQLSALVFDLRGNTGGLLHEAVNVANVFLPKGSKVVSIRGRDKEKQQIYQTQNQAVDAEIPLIILIDGSSASASEIVAGALQDFDRAVIIGQKSFGKGLVQSTKDLPYGGKLKLTTAKYYLPSGRCIQSLVYKDGKSVTVPDSDRAIFKTENGRKVLDGAGIFPDLTTIEKEEHEILSKLSSERQFFYFAVDYILNNKIAGPEEFSLDASVYDKFITYLEKNNFNFVSETENSLNQLAKKAKTEGISTELNNEIDAMKSAFRKEKLSILSKYKNLILFELQKEISLQVHLKRGSIQNSLSKDPDILKSLEILSNTSNYNKILNP